ncbi:hypothetical protein SDC9_156934 [bioreactor metagenome]|uniref:Uncharacterized protein n=1 Tax=bioreactor metagenome TaxID=1076179 RepID=A0A645FB08_9ZZZZ
MKCELGVFSAGDDDPLKPLRALPALRGGKHIIAAVGPVIIRIQAQTGRVGRAVQLCPLAAQKSAPDAADFLHHIRRVIADASPHAYHRAGLQLYDLIFHTLHPFVFAEAAGTALFVL